MIPQISKCFFTTSLAIGLVFSANSLHASMADLPSRLGDLQKSMGKLKGNLTTFSEKLKHLKTGLEDAGKAPAMSAKQIAKEKFDKLPKPAVESIKISKIIDDEPKSVDDEQKSANESFFSNAKANAAIARKEKEAKTAADILKSKKDALTQKINNALEAYKNFSTNSHYPALKSPQTLKTITQASSANIQTLEKQHIKTIANLARIATVQIVADWVTKVTGESLSKNNSFILKALGKGNTIETGKTFGNLYLAVKTAYNTIYALDDDTHIPSASDKIPTILNPEKLDSLTTAIHALNEKWAQFVQDHPTTETP